MGDAKSSLRRSEPPMADDWPEGPLLADPVFLLGLAFECAEHIARFSDHHDAGIALNLEDRSDARAGPWPARLVVGVLVQPPGDAPRGEPFAGEQPEDPPNASHLFRRARRQDGSIPSHRLSLARPQDRADLARLRCLTREEAKLPSLANGSAV